uniref:AB hydrolase-1 domain-containing protein n=2 Tax=Alexandrium monilatum TaxID=311494 RepID=A0A7S4RDE2_9DINO
MVAEELQQPGFRLERRGAGRPLLPCMRHNLEPLRYRHFPLSMYVFTQGLLGVLTDRSLHRLGFRPYVAGRLWRYWLWRPRGLAPAGQGLPVFFVHGVGVGLLPYLGLLRVLMERGVPVFLLEVPFISMKIDTEVPAAADTARAAGAILQLHGFSRADFVGHSFGTVVLSWIWRYNPGCVAGLVLLDPVVILLHSYHVLYNFLYRKPRPWNPLDHISSEFFLSHGLRRHLCWHESILWPQELRRASVPFLAVCAAEDEIAPGPTVHGFLERIAGTDPAEGTAAFEAVLLPGRRHGDVLADREAANALRRFFACPPATGADNAASGG